MSNNLRQNYCVNRREYNRLLERKRKEHNSEIMDKLNAATNNAKDFWEVMHQIAPKRQFKRNNINEETCLINLLFLPKHLFIKLDT